MSKLSKRKQKNNQRNLYIIAGIVIVAVAIFALVASQQTAVVSSIGKIAPSDYLAQYVNNNTDHLLLDVRTPEEFASGHIHGAVNIPVESLQSRISEVPNDLPIIVYCRSGNRSAQASQILSQANYTRIYDMGGLNSWTAQGLPVE